MPSFECLVKVNGTPAKGLNPMILQVGDTVNVNVTIELLVTKVYPDNNPNEVEIAPKGPGSLPERF